ncbi:MAG TPA: HlyC/CorC family transporter [Deltaproteobacteria bacterium]|nr:HlyC/CorC family transporter [Deltaproteobacteria bacterium]
MQNWHIDLINILVAVLLVILNGFFVAAEFSLVKVRESRIAELEKQKRLFASTAGWLLKRLDASLSACQLGITMASLGLGWIGEPAVAHLLRPVILVFGFESEILIHSIAFVVAFSAITAVHLVIGEQAPKIFALRRPEMVLLWCALPMKIFYLISFPFVIGLNNVTAYLLRRIGIESASEHEAIHSEEEIRALLSTSHKGGEVSRSEHRLINAVFDFDELVCRKVMIPRSDVVFLNAEDSLPTCLDLVKKEKHSRYPVCEGTLDDVIGVIHIKDLIGMTPDQSIDLRSIMRSPPFVPETVPVKRLLRQFQETHQHMAFIVDEHGSVVGIITLENILELIVGSVEDEFDMEPPNIVTEAPGRFVVRGSTPLLSIQRELKLDLSDEEADTMAGLLMSKTGEILKPGDRVSLRGAEAEVLEVEGSRAMRIRITLTDELKDQA